MTRITSTVLVLLILMNGTVTIMDVSGLSEDIGVSLGTGVDDAMDSVVNEMKQGFSPDISVIESLISMLTAGLNLFRVVIEGVLAAPTMMINLLGGGQMVETVVTVLFAPMYLISALELVFIATGRNLI